MVNWNVLLSIQLITGLLECKAHSGVSDGFGIGRQVVALHSAVVVARAKIGLIAHFLSISIRYSSIYHWNKILNK